MSVSLNPLQRYFFNTETLQLVKEQRIRDYGMLSHKWSSIAQFFHTKLQDYCRRGGGK